jgi:bifunctional non-homologous end joining protein LigD
VFDLLGVDGTDVTGLPFSERRALLEKLVVGGSGWTLSETFEDGEALYGAVCEHGFEGVVAKNCRAATSRASAGGSS